MSEIISCPQCERKLRVPENLIGQRVKCPTCGATFTAAAAPPSSRNEGLEDEPRERVGKSIRPSRPPEEKGEPSHRPVPPPRDTYDEESPEEDYSDEPRPRRRRRRLRMDTEPHRGTLILTMGIMSLVICGFLGPVAWIMGNADLKAIREGQMDPSGEGLTQAGRICGMISTGFLILGCVISSCYMIFMIGMIGAARR